MDKKINNHLALLLILTLVSCAPTAYLSSKVDPHFSFVKSQPIFVNLGEQATVEDKQFHNLLVTEMKRAGFTVIEEPTRNSLVLFFGLGEDTTFIDSPLVFPSTSTTTGAIGNESFTATTRGTQVVPSQFPYTAQRILLLLYRNTREGKLDNVWEAYLGTEQKNFHYDSSAVVSQLLNVIGKNFEGDVNLKSERPDTQEDSREVAQLKKQVRSLQDVARFKGTDAGPTDSEILREAFERSKQDVAELKASCDQEAISACAELGFRYQFGHGVTQNNLTAATLYEKGCGADDPKACAGLGMLYAEGHGVTRDHNRAKSLFTKSCDNGFAKACLILGGWLQSGTVGGKDPAQAVRLFEKACDDGEGIGCYLLSLEYFIGRTVPENAKRGMALLEQGCDIGVPAACSEAATQYRRGLYIQKNTHKTTSLQKKAFPLYQKACEDGRSASCRVLGAYYEMGKVVQQDMSQALLYYERACEVGSLSGCVLLGDLYVEGNGVPKDPAKAAQIYDGACETKELAYWERKDYWKTNCYRKLATLLKTGQGGTKDQARAAVLYRKACDEGDDPSCVRLGQLLIEEPGAAANKNDALPLLRKGCQSVGGESCLQLGAALADLCERGQTDACIELSDMNYKGLVTSKEVPLVESVDQSLCNNGNLASCYRVADKKIGEAAGQFYDLVEQAESRFGFVQKVIETGGMKHYQWTMEELISHLSSQKDSDATELLGRLAEANKKLLEAENAFYYKYCQAGHLDSCKRLDQLAWQYSDGIARPVEPIRAETLARLACEEGLADACTRLGKLYEEGTGTSLDSSRAAEVYLKACNLENAQACWELARMYKQGRGVQLDASHAESLYRRSVAIRRRGCEKLDDLKDSRNPFLKERLQEENYLYNCLWLAMHYEAGWGVPLDDNVASSLYMKACSGGYGPKEACEKAVPFYNQDCKKGRASACTILGKIYDYGRIAPRDMGRAEGFFKQACSENDGEGCYQLGVMYKRGQGDFNNPIQAQSFFEKACRFGYKPGCRHDPQ